MKKTNMDLIVGGSILVALFILVAGVLWLKEVSVTRKLVSYTVIFPNVGTLQVGDPVMINGVRKGAVESIKLRGVQVAAILKIDQDVLITDSSRITVQNIGLMGERGIGVLLSEKGTIVKPNSKKDTTYVYGNFDTGIAEAMGMMGTVLGDVEKLIGNVSGIVESTVGDTAFLSLFSTMVARLDTITLKAQGLVVKNEPAINRSIQNLSSVSTDLKGLLDRNSSHIDAMLSNGEELTRYSLTIANQVDSLTGSLHAIVTDIESGRGALGKLIQDEQFYGDLKQTVANLDTLVNEVQGDALKLRIKLGFGKKKK